MGVKFSFQPAFVAASVMLAISSPAIADDNDDMEHLTIFGDVQSINDLPGSAHMISEKDLEKFDFTDIMRTLTSVPGVYVLEEDGYGLRPNIGMRGTGQNRSEKVTILEDNVLAAPAPYSAPSAYYFPTVGRMQQIEVLKGTSSAMYGPRTTGGVLNMLSRQIPEESLAGVLKASAGQDGFAKLHGYAGGSGENVSSLIEVFRYQADGFKDINHSSEETGFMKNDILAKLQFNSDAKADFYQELEFKVKYSDEDSDDTYMGLTAEDYDNDTFSRYSASQKDNMDTEHKQFQVNHFIQLSDRYTLGSTAYYNEFSRNWYKVNKINGASLGSGGIEMAAAFDKDTEGNSLTVDVKANNRDYTSQGIQTVLDADFNDHQVKLGARYHEDDMDRFQWVDKYTIDSNYNMALNADGAGVPGTDSNRIDSAHAIAIYVQDEYTIDDFIITAGLRYEDMTMRRRDWGKNDPARDNEPGKKLKNEVDVWLPSVALTYKYSDSLVLLAGVQKGFAPPAPGNEQAENEESYNYEAGLRYNSDLIQAEAIAFFSDYDNMHGNCTASQGCDDDNIGNQYNAGEVEVYGLELMAGNQFEIGQLTMPIDVTYTYTDTEFQNSFESGLDTWGDVLKGDEMPYVPENQLQMSIGLEGEKWRSNVLVRYMDDMRTNAGQGDIASEDLIENRTVVDMSAQYDIADNQVVSLSIDNLLDEEYMASKTHGSIMVGKPRSVMVGYSYSF